MTPREFGATGPLAAIFAMPGAVEAVAAVGEGVAYLKIDPARFDAVDRIVAG
jgi:hypothetical protein